MVENTKDMKFYDVKSKKKFTPKSYQIKIRNNRRFAVAKNPKTGVMSWRVLGMTKKSSKSKSSSKKK